MQKKLLCAIFALLIFAIPCWAKPVISIQPFIDKAGVGSQIASAITDMMTTELMNTGAFDIVERERLGEIGAEQKLGQSGLVDSSTAPKVGKLTGAEYMITGAITQFHYQTPGGAAILPGVGGGFVSNTGYVTLDVRIVSNTTGRVTFTSRQEGAATNSSGALISVFGGFGTIKHGGVMAAATQKAVSKVADDIRARIGGGATSGGGSASGLHVLCVSGNSVTIDAGSSLGARRGQHYAVYSESGVIKGLDGSVLGIEKNFKSVIVVEDVNPNYSTAKIIKGSKDLKRGDLLEKVSDPSSVKL